MQKTFDERFVNWIHWCNSKGMHQDRARSVEGHYRSPQHWNPPTPKPDWLLTMDVNDAVLVNRAYSQLGEKTRRIIKILWFRPHWRPQWQAQKLGCHHTDLPDMANFAKRVMNNRLDFLERKISITVRVSVTTEKSVNPPEVAELRSKAPA